MEHRHFIQIYNLKGPAYEWSVNTFFNLSKYLLEHLFRQPDVIRILLRYSVFWQFF